MNSSCSNKITKGILRQAQARCGAFLRPPLDMNRRLLLLTNILLFACSCTYGQYKKSLHDTNFVQGDTLVISELIFDLSYPMRSETHDSLDLVIDFLSRNPDLIVEIALHTDSRGDMAMNLKMSQYRATHVCNYLYSKLPDDPTRVTCKGYGETQILVKEKEILRAATKEEKENFHRQNRRTELIVKEVK
jgi:peptidoglycan-associated lipoprotein